MKQALIFLFFLSVSCTKLSNGTNSIQLTKNKLSIILSHNINGETHPCGCRHFPLGGLPQVAGQIHEISKTNDIFYIDTGDTFFPSSTLPKSVEKSLTFAARNLADGLDKIGLKYLVPGDQDFAAGVDFLKDLVESHRFEFLVSNLKDPKTFKHKKIAILEKDEHKIFMLGFVNPKALINYGNLFENPLEHFEKSQKLLKDSGFDNNNPKHRLIVFSHAGIDEDEKLAEKYPEIDWILGAHSQSFTRFPQKAGKKTKLAQVLSRNHYLGDLTINFSGTKSKDQFQIYEIRDELKNKLPSNPFITFIEDHKNRMSKIQIEEQSEGIDFSKVGKFNTATNCLECHAEKKEHWSQAPHSLAYGTLLHAKEQHNMDCLKCHTLGTNSPRGYTNSKELVVFSEDIETNKLEKVKKNYWKDIQNTYKGIKSIRKLSPEKIEAINQKLAKIDTKYRVTHNFMNVQCLSCHPREDGDHPFDTTAPKKFTKKEKYQYYKSICLKCHDPLQAPQWYKKDSRGIATILDEKMFRKNLEKVGHPRK